MEATSSVYFKLLHQEVVPALGCTEPVAVALCVARAREALGSPVVSIEVQVSANIFKNGMGVGIPGTGRTGLPIAAALGAVYGQSSDKLELLQGVTPGAVAQAAAMLEQKGVTVAIAQGSPKLYVKATVYDAQRHAAHCVIVGSHSHIAEVGQDDRIVYRDRAVDENAAGAPAEPELTGRDITLRGAYQFAMTTPVEDLEFILDSVKLNNAISREGLSKPYGLQVGRKLALHMQQGLLAHNVLTEAMSRTAAASDARMDGSTMPVMSNSGSGNQGITATMPVVVMAEHLDSSREQLARALTLAHLVAIHIKGYIGRLSPLCGCVVASAGAACGAAYLLGGDYAAICATVKNMIGNVTGMVCDGAKVGCALKVSSGVSSAIQSALLAVDGICISSHDGIIDDDVEKTIANLGRVGQEAMAVADNVLLDIMMHKSSKA